MNNLSVHLAALRRAIETPTDGFVGMVDAILWLCRQHALALDWRLGQCIVRSAGGDEEGIFDVSLRKSAFRAVLARVATLCDEQARGSFAPYGGQGELALGSDPQMALRLAWVNTPDEQKLTVTPIFPPVAYSESSEQAGDPKDRSRTTSESESETAATNAPHA